MWAYDFVFDTSADGQQLKCLTRRPASASRRKPMICSSEKRFFTSNLLRLGDWIPNCCATQKRGDVGD